MSQGLYAGIDAGGTTFKCVLGCGPNHIMASADVPVGEPSQTLAECAEFFKKSQARYGVANSLGLACFGPIDLHPQSPTYGCIKSTPKPHWSDVDVMRFFQTELSLPIVFDTDVNGALLGELRWGGGRGFANIVYVTVGTGIGAGVMMNSRLVYGALHTEAGHMLVPRRMEDSFRGACPFHGGCLEGLASGTAVAERWQVSADELAADHPAWELEAHYLASACVNLSMLYSPEKIILGGGIMRVDGLLSLIRRSFLSQVNAYPFDLSASIDEFISLPELGSNAGLLGALALAMRIKT